MLRKTRSNWHDWLTWSAVALGLLVLLIPRPVKLALALPLQTALLAPLRIFRVLRLDIGRLKAENRRLAQLAAWLAVDNARLRTRAAEPRPPEVGLDLLSAPVITRDIATLRHFLVVARGARHDVTPASPVMTPDGVVGKVVAVGPAQSLVETLLAPDSRIAVINSRSRSSALARPVSGGVLRLEYAPTESDFQPGDTLLTAGLGGVFPRGLAVGVVTRVEDPASALFRTVTARPLARIAQLEYVFLVRRTERSVEEEDGWLDNLGPAEVRIPGE